MKDTTALGEIRRKLHDDRRNDVEKDAKGGGRGNKGNKDNKDDKAAK